MTTQEELVELVESDPDRTGAEKESAFTMLGDEKVITAMSAKATIVRSLLKHDHFEPEWFVVEDGGKANVETIEDAADADAIYAVSGEMPVGCLTVKSAPRSNDHQSSIVNAEGVQPGAFS